jgi:hypothetical protein
MNWVSPLMPPMKKANNLLHREMAGWGCNFAACRWWKRGQSRPSWGCSAVGSCSWTKCHTTR